MEVNLFHWADYAVFIILLLVSAGIGIFYGIKDRKAPNPEEYLVGGRSMHVLPVSISIFVSYTSAITFLGEPVEAYTFGAGYLFVILGLACAIPWIAEVFAPFYHSQNLISAFEVCLLFYHFQNLITALELCSPFYHFQNLVNALEVRST